MSSWYSDRPDDYYTTPNTDSADLINIHSQTVDLDLQSDVEPWLDRAACAGFDPRLFNASPVPASTRAICDRCPVIADCLRWTMDTDDIHVGYAAGLTGPEREAMSERLAA